MNHTTIYGKTAVMKYAVLNSIYKWNDNLAEENYRPVGVLPTLPKIYGSSLNDQLDQYFVIIFNAFFSDYPEGYNGQSLLLMVTDDWKKFSVKIKSLGPFHGPVWSVCQPFTFHTNFQTHVDDLYISACNFMVSYLQDRK